MIIAILLVMGGTFLWRDSKTEHASEGAASAAGEHGAESGAQKKATAAPAPPENGRLTPSFLTVRAGSYRYLSPATGSERAGVVLDTVGG